MFTLSNIILIITATFTALIAGLFWGWSISVILGSARLSDKEYISFMQATNRAILNPIFYIVFLGTPLLLPITTFLHYGQNERFWILLIATTIYLIGVMGVTMFGNVPLNNKLDRFEMDPANEKEIANQRINYAKPWNLLNHIRALFSVISIVLLIVACLS